MTFDDLLPSGWQKQSTEALARSVTRKLEELTPLERYNVLLPLVRHRISMLSRSEVRAAERSIPTRTGPRYVPAKIQRGDTVKDGYIEMLKRDYGPVAKDPVPVVKGMPPVPWGELTIEDISKRVAMYRKQIDGMEESVAKLERLATALRAIGASTLNEVLHA